MAKINFQNSKNIIGMIHCLPLPGAANYGGSMQAVVDRALYDLQAMQRAGVDAVIVENFCDKPVSAKLSQEQLAALSVVSAAVVRESTIPVGIDAAFCDPMASLAIAAATGAAFIRVPVFVDTVITSDGVISPCAKELLRYRRLLEAEDVALLCDIQTKHTYMLNPAIPITESAVMAQDSGADAIIITGAHTGSATPLDTIRVVREAVSLPLIVGSGVKITNVEEQMALVDAAIVGSSMKAHGLAEEPIDECLAAALMEKVRTFRAGSNPGRQPAHEA